MHIEQSEIKNSDIEVIINHRTSDEVLLNDLKTSLITDRNSQKFLLNFYQTYQWNNKTLIMYFVNLNHYLAQNQA